MKKLMILGAGVLVGLLVWGSQASASSDTRWVNDDAPNAGGYAPPGTSCDNPGYATIQAAVDAASDGDTIKVCDGTYEEQVVISGFDQLKLEAASTPVVEPPAPPAPGFSGAIIKVEDSKDVTIKGFKVDGAEKFDSEGGIEGTVGIYYKNSSGIIRDNEVTRIRRTPLSGTQDGHGILARDINNDGKTSKVEIRDNTVTDYQKTGILALGDLKVDIKGNATTGAGPLIFQGQNGIQVGAKASGKVEQNTVSDVYYTPRDTEATGILILDSDKVEVKRNQITNAENGVAVVAWCRDSKSANKNEVEKNTIVGSDFGVVIFSISGIFSYCGADPEVRDNKVIGNTITLNQAGLFKDPPLIPAGVLISALDVDPGGGGAPIAENNEVHGNTILTCVPAPGSVVCR